MSFYKLFSSCCPFLIAPAMDTDDDMYSDCFQKFDFDDEFLGTSQYTPTGLNEGEPCTKRLPLYLLNKELVPNNINNCNNANYSKSAKNGKHCKSASSKHEEMRMIELKEGDIVVHEVHEDVL